MVRYPGHTGGVNALAMAPNGERFLSGSQDHTLRLWDIDSGQEIRRFGAAKNEAAIAAGNETLRDDREQINGHADQHQTNHNHHERVGQDLLQAPLVSANHAVVNPFGKAPPTAPRRLAALFVKRAGSDCRLFEQTRSQHRR